MGEESEPKQARNPNHSMTGTLSDARVPGYPMHVYEVRPRRDKRGFDLISDALPFGGLWYLNPRDAIEYAQHNSRAHDAVISVYDRGQMLTIFFSIRRYRG